MQILILGGTGAIGVSMTQILSRHGDEVFVTSRSVHESRDNIHYVQGNAMDDDFLCKILAERDWDAVIDLMIYQVSNFAARLDLLLASTRHYFFFSSSRVYADSKARMTENSPRLLDISIDKRYLTTSDYALTKAREEDLLYESESKNWTIIRPYITYNFNRLQLGVFEKEYWLYRALKGRTIVFQQEIARHITTLTYGYDVGDAVAKLIGNQNAQGEVVHITTDETVIWDEVLQLYLSVIEEKTGIRPKVIYIKDSKWLSFIMGNNYQVQYDRCFDRLFDNSKVRALVECTQFISPKEGLRDCLKQFLESPSFREGIGVHSWIVEGYMDRITGERASLNEITSTGDKLKYLLFRYAPFPIVICLKKIRAVIGEVVRNMG